MKRRLIKLGVFLLLGAVINVAVAWGFVAVHGSVRFEWNPHHNPRQGDPIAFFVIRRMGVEWVMGCGRPGTLMERHAARVRSYLGEPWWPSEAVTFDDGPCGVAAGWPLLSFSAWRTITTTELPGDEGLEFRRMHHWGFVISDPPQTGWEELPAILPLRPIWLGFAINSLFYTVILWLLVAAPFMVRRQVRLRSGRCLVCNYDLRGTPHQVCPECGAAFVASCSKGSG